MPGRTKARAEPAADAAMEDVPSSAQKAHEVVEDGDDAMVDSADGQEEEEEEEELPKLPGSSDTAASFEFEKESHTLGNALRYIIMKNPDVEFCAYAIPHPSEQKMNLRIQTYNDYKATDALKKGLQDLEDLCDVVSDEFWTRRNEFNEKNGILRD
ncbi:DNA-directed RNA polymerase [Microdochium trichocladiopsis]|uniref:DNA-directed RNA polymerases I and III subunit RPAC2 n=1 Tax=Microdochium trichocladiopsis TaxID=1682393 RepID=A0A9P8YIN3_9PEZI|nr:DNA-directed RNA polymerase [Microdochium trichocladiopsis]KAH7040985.1 DNA-directed RNA polymerase [Microdochium trichocladiopsis]